MKKILAAILALTLVFAMAVSVGAKVSPTPKEFFDVTVRTEGSGDADADPYKVEKNEDGSSTLTATEKNGKFQRWEIEGEYEILEGSLTSKVIRIRPLSDIVATAIFTEGSKGDSNPNTDSTSPKTGDMLFYALGMLTVALGVGVFAFRKVRG